VFVNIELMQHWEDEIFQLKRLKEGSERAFDALYNQYSGKLYNFIMTISNRDCYMAEEIMQEVFLKIWEIRHEINPDKSFIAYIYTIARNMLMNNYQHRTVEFVYKEYVQKNTLEAETNTEEQIEYNLLSQYIDTIIEKLPQGRRQVYLLSRKEHFSNKEIAKKLDISESTVEKQLSKAIQFVREQILLHYDKIFLLLISFMLK
jgi:RNA polymerase sigma-70 factor (ECF subfamily)